MPVSASGYPGLQGASLGESRSRPAAAAACVKAAANRGVSAALAVIELLRAAGQRHDSMGLYQSSCSIRCRIHLNLFPQPWLKQSEFAGLTWRYENEIAGRF